MDSGAHDVKIALKALGNKLGNTGIATKIQVGPQTLSHHLKAQIADSV